MKKLLLMSVALAATSGLFAKKVKFQVDMTGKTIAKELFRLSKNLAISPEKLQAGIYLLTLKIGTQTQTFKIAKW